ncbi:MAG: aldehyde dehydrogenase [Actinobacteria bacterium]|nr:aldehyde dehydrogenase [Actinomycetota bacterium]
MTIPAEMFVGGGWVPALSGRTREATSPSTGGIIGQVAEGGRDDARRAVEAAADAFEAWSRLTAFERAAALDRVAEICECRRTELAHALTLDQGKPLHREAFVEVDELIEMWREGGQDAIRVAGSIPPSRSGAQRILLLPRPLGPVAVVTPWNWPYTMAAEIIAPALAAGNTVVWTPAPSTAACSVVLASCVAEAELPAGVFNLVLGPGPEVGDEIVGHRVVAAVGFIGSTATGLHVARRAAGKAQILEMGGNGPLVVLADADLEAAAEAAVDGSFYCAGQSCTAAERILVQEPVVDEFVERLAARIDADVRLGDPFAEETTMGPLNNPGVAEKMDLHVNDAIERGARVVRGGTTQRDAPTALYWQPTLLAGVAPDSLAAREETFGPIAPVLPFSTFEQALESANATGYGLTAAIFTGDLGAGLRFAEQARFGLVNVNESTNYFEGHVPFGGRAGTASGIGRVGGRAVIDALTEVQTVTLRP